MPNGQVLEFAHVTKRFGAVTAVSDLSVRVEPGAVTGFLGPNGAGKTTSLRILLGQIRPTSGTATIGGVPYSELRQPLRTVGAVLEESAYRPRRTATRQLTIAAKANGIPGERVAEVLHLVGLQDDADTRLGSYSLGMRQRLAVATALLGDPGVLVLDEPANGLDPEGIRWMRLLMRRLADEGRTVLVSSHVLSEIEQVADAVVVLSRGQAVYSGGIDELADPAGGAVVVDADDRIALVAALTSAGLAFDLLRSGVTVRDSDAARVGAVAAEAGVALSMLQQRGPSLEEVFLDLVYGRRSDSPRLDEVANPVAHAEASSATAVGDAALVAGGVPLAGAAAVVADGGTIAAAGVGYGTAPIDVVSSADAGESDTEAADAGESDTEAADAGTADAGEAHAQVAAAGEAESGVADAQVAPAGEAEAEKADAEKADAEMADAVEVGAARGDAVDSDSADAAAAAAGAWASEEAADTEAPDLRDAAGFEGGVADTTPAAADGEAGQESAAGQEGTAGQESTAGQENAAGQESTAGQEDAAGDSAPVEVSAHDVLSGHADEDLHATDEVDGVEGDSIDTGDVEADSVDTDDPKTDSAEVPSPQDEALGVTDSYASGQTDEGASEEPAASADTADSDAESGTASESDDGQSDRPDVLPLATDSISIRAATSDITFTGLITGIPSAAADEEAKPATEAISVPPITAHHDEDDDDSAVDDSEHDPRLAAMRTSLSSAASRFFDGSAPDYPYTPSIPATDDESTETGPEQSQDERDDDADGSAVTEAQPGDDTQRTEHENDDESRDEHGDQQHEHHAEHEGQHDPHDQHEIHGDHHQNHHEHHDGDRHHG